MSLKDENRAKNIAQFEDLERRHENGDKMYFIGFTLRDAEHEIEFMETISGFYGNRLDMPQFSSAVYPKAVKATIISRDMINAMQTQLCDNEDEDL